MSGEVARFQAKWQLDLILPEQVPAAAAAMLEAGVEGDSLPVLAGLTNPCRSEVEPFVRRFLADHNAKSMTDTAARWLLVRAGVEAIAVGTLPPRTGADQIAALCRELGMPQLLRYFMYLSADYDPDDSWFDDRIRETAAEVLAELRASPGVAT